LEADPLVLAAVALPVPGGTEDLLAEQTVALGLERAVVDGLRLLDLAEGPAPDGVGRSQADADPVEVIHVQHSDCFLLFEIGLVDGRWLHLFDARRLTTRQVD